MRRAAAFIKQLTPGPVSHDTYMTLVWRILAAGDREKAGQLHSSHMIKPFTWSIEKWPSEGATLTFSAIDPELVAIFKRGCTQLRADATMIGKQLFLVDNVYFIRDLDYIGPFIRLQSVMPITVTVSRQKEKKKQYVFFNTESGEAEIWLQRVQDNLKKRTKLFLNAEPRVQIRVMKAGGVAVIAYKGGKIPAQFVQVKITGDQEALLTAIYGGLGEHTGSGFGMMIPV